MRTKLFLALAVLGLCHASAFAATTNVDFGGATHTFRPSVITINVGDTVDWVLSGAPGPSNQHSVTGSNTVSEPLCGTSFPVSGCTNTFLLAGQWAYYCENHVLEGMTGLVIVASVALPPSVSISAPTNGTVYAAPANVHISAAAAGNGGATVTNVEFFKNGTSVGKVATSPFSITASNLAAGSYNLTAAATDNNGLSATSSPPVNISVVTPVAVSNYFPRVTNGQFIFDHTANPGLSYVAQSTANFTNWAPVATNTAVSNSVEVHDSFSAGSLRFYRVGRLPNP